MKITKLEHACLLLEIEGKRVFIDPGSYTREVGNYQEVAAVVITHTHDDHCSEAQLDALLKNNPNLEIYGTAEVQERLSAYKVTAVHHGDFYQVGQFQLEFFGDLHLEIHRSIPIIQNCGVLVNRKL